MKIAYQHFLFLVAALPFLEARKHLGRAASLDHDHSFSHASSKVKGSGYPYGYPKGWHNGHTAKWDNFQKTCSLITDKKQCQRHDACAWYGDFAKDSPERHKVMLEVNAILSVDSYLLPSLPPDQKPDCWIHPSKFNCYYAEWHSKSTEGSRWNWYELILIFHFIIVC
jgi:hypothetical protein